MSPTFQGQISIRHYSYLTFSKFRANFKKISGYSKKIFDFLGIRIRLFEISNYPNRSESDLLLSDDISIRLFDIRSTTSFPCSFYLGNPHFKWCVMLDMYIIGEIKTGILFKDFYICTTYRKRQKFELISYCFFDPHVDSRVISGQKIHIMYKSCLICTML